MKHAVSVIAVICIFSAAALAQTGLKTNLVVAPTVAKSGAPADAPSDADEFVLGPEDVLSIIVWHEPELTENKVIVRPDGKIGLPLLNDVQAAGLTPKHLQENITEAFKTFVTDPQVSVLVQEIHSQVVFIIGAVKSPGAYPIGGPTTVMELLGRAGGLVEFAKSDEIQIVRKENGKPRRLIFNYKQFVEGKNYQQNVRLRSGDMVIVQ
jgi:polysaccharide export outer membrane protein